MERLILSKIEKIQKSFREERDFSLYVLAGAFIGIGTGIYNTIFNNYLNDVYHLTSSLRGAVEFPRELPGASVMIVLGLFAFLGNTRISMLAMCACTLGLAGLGLFTQSFGLMLFWLITFSLGQHLYMPVSPAIGMSLSKAKNYGSRLGLYSAYMLSATIAGYAIVWIGFRFLGMNYNSAFVLAAVFFCHCGNYFRFDERQYGKS